MQQYRKRPRGLVVLLLPALLTSCTVVVEGWLPIGGGSTLNGSRCRRLGRSHLLFSLQQHNDTKTNGLFESPSATSSNLEEDEKLRFGGVARLYAANVDSISSSSGTQSSATDDAPWTILERLRKATVAVVGLGGVGSWSAEALCRSGIGNLILVDLDDICISNTNRQLHALSSTVGNMKIDEMKRRLLDINPACSITLIHDFVAAENVHDLLLRLQDSSSNNNRPTAVLDAIDGSREKSALLAACVDLNIPIVTVGGAAGRKDPTQILCSDLTVVSGDKLLATCRKNLRKFYGFEQGLSFSERKKKTRKLRKWNIDCVFSTEEQKSLPDGKSNSSSLRRCDGALGTACFVTGTFGFVAAARVVDMIADNKLTSPRRG